jgi:hypothetical protein
VSAILEAALEYAHLGLRVLPVEPRGKRPLLGDWPNAASTDEQTIRGWWDEDPDANVGLVCGDVFEVVDEDRPGALGAFAIPETVESKTPHGRHIAFKTNGSPLRNRVRAIEGVDVRSNGGFVVAPPSIGADGTPYVWTRAPGTVPFAEMPHELRQALTAPKPEPPPARRPANPATVADAYGRRALEDESAAVRSAPEGNRNATLNSAAFSLGQLVGGGVLDRATVEETLFAAGLSAGLGERETIRTIASGIEAGLLEPRAPEPQRPALRIMRMQVDLAGADTVELEEPPHLRDEPPAPAARDTREPRERDDKVEVVWKSASVKALLEGEDEPIPWLIPGYVARDESSTFVGDPKCAKTWLLFSGCVYAAIGRPVWGRYPVERPLRVVWGDEEMGLGKLKRRIRRLVAGGAFTAAEIELLDENLDLRPQQGFSFGAEGALEALYSSLDKTPPDIFVLDSLPAFQQGEENSATERRRFYNTVVAPIKSAYKCAVILPAHPPLPSKNAPADSQKRARGSGDVRAFVDRNFYMEKIGSEKNEHGDCHTLIVNADLEREGGSQERQVFVLEDTGPGATVCSAKGDYASAEGMAVIGKANACQKELLFALEKAGGEMYQPDLKQELEGLGFSRQHEFQPAMKALTALDRVRNIGPKKGTGKSGDWIKLVSDDDPF